MLMFGVAFTGIQSKNDREGEFIMHQKIEPKVTLKGDLRFQVYFMVFVTLFLSQGGYSQSPKPLSIGTSSEFESLHPLIQSSASASYLTDITMPPLVFLDDDWKWTCKLCETVPTLENGLAKIIEEGGKKRIQSTWTLKPHLKWADGTPLTGKDFQLGLEIGKSPHVLIPDRDTFSRINRIQVDAKIPTKFIVYSEALDYRFVRLSELTPIPHHVEGALWEKHKGQPQAYEKNSLYITKPETQGLWYGPYVVKEVKLGSHVTMVSNPLWQEPPPAFSPVIFKFIANNQTLEASLLSKQIDLIYELSIFPDQCLAFEDRLTKDRALAQRFQVLYKPGITLAQLTLNGEQVLLKDKAVRQAIQMGIDREKVVQALFKGKSSLSHQFFSPLDELYDKTLAPIQYQPREAEALLDKAQWKKGEKGLRSKEGVVLRFQLLAASGVKTLEVVQQYIKAELAKIGIEVSLKNEPARVLFGETLQKRRFDGMALFSWVSNPGDIPSTLFRSDSIPSAENSWSGQNFMAWKNPKVDELMDQAAQELDTQKRIRLMAEFNKLYRDEALQIPLYHRIECAIIPKDLRGFKLYGTLTKSAHDLHRWSR